MKIKKLGALLVSAALCVGMAAPAFAFEGEAAPAEQPVLPEIVEELRRGLAAKTRRKWRTFP